MKSGNKIVEKNRTWSTGAKVALFAILIGFLICCVGAQPALTTTGEANADGISYKIEGQNIILSWGEKPTGGYVITIDSLEVRGDTLTVLYSLKAPGPEEFVTQAITYPRATAVIPGGSVPAKVELIKNGRSSENSTLIVENQQVWTIPLNQAIDPTTVTSESVVVLNSRGQKATGFQIMVGSDEKSIIVKLPAKLAADTYTVWVKNTVKTAAGKAVAGTKKQYVHKTGPLPVVGSLDNLKNLLAEAEAARLNDMGYFRGTATSKEIAGISPMGDTAQNDSLTSDYSGTNLQVAGVDEADVVKTDGSYIYQVNNREIKIIKAYPASKLRVVSSLSFTDTNFNPQELYVDRNRLVVIGSTYSQSPYPAGLIENKARAIYPPIINNQLVKALVYDITDRSNAKKIREIDIEGNYLSSRKVGNSLYLVANKWINYYRSETGNEATDLRPYYRDSAVGAKMLPIDYSAIRYFPGCIQPNYLIVAGVNLAKNEPMTLSTYLGAGQNIYCSEKNLYVAIGQQQYFPRPLVGGALIMEDGVSREIKTKVYRLALNNGRTECTGRGEVPGTILNQFSMDEHRGYFRIATTTGDMWRSDERTSKNNIYTLNSQMAIAGRLENIAPGERIYSTRFMGDRVYMVTFKQVDPLFVIDLKNPAKPKILGALKIPGYSDYLHPYDDNHIIGFGKDTVEVKAGQGTQAFYTGMKIALFDVTDVSKPKELFKEIIGDRGTESELLRNHKALLFSRNKNLLAFPVTVMKARGQETSGMPAYGQFEFQGAYVYRVDPKQGFQLKARITHLTGEDYQKSGGSWYNNNRNVERILYINDGLYTLSKERIRVHDLSSFKGIGSLWL